MPGKKSNPKTHVRFMKLYIPPVSEQLSAMSQHHNSDSSDEEEEPYYPPIIKGCFNCRGSHDHRWCPRPQYGPYCYTCGWPGKTKGTCPRPSCRMRHLTSWVNQTAPRARGQRAGVRPLVRVPSPEHPKTPPQRSEETSHERQPGPSWAQDFIEEVTVHRYTPERLLSEENLELLIPPRREPELQDDPETEDLIDLHPSRLDEQLTDSAEDISAASEFDIREEVSKFEERGTYPT